MGNEGKFEGMPIEKHEPDTARPKKVRAEKKFPVPRIKSQKDPYPKITTEQKIEGNLAIKRISDDAKYRFVKRQVADEVADQKARRELEDK